MRLSIWEKRYLAWVTKSSPFGFSFCRTFWPSLHIFLNYKYTEIDIIQMLQFLVDNIFVVFRGKFIQQIVGIPMGTNCAHLFALNWKKKK